jgi:hypothetical protein
MAMSKFVAASISDGDTCHNVNMQCQNISLCGIKGNFDEALS